MSSSPAKSAAPSPPLAPGSARFPFTTHPKGWFVVALSADIPPGEVVRLHYFGRDLVAYRGASGRVYVTDAYCPHLGAHLGHGGKIEGETIRCPYHGWRFEGDGRCAEVPYSDRIPPGACLDALPVREQNGVVHVFHDPAGGPPWELPVLDEDVWTEGRVVVWRGLKTHVQEVFENTVDTAHILPVHDGRDVRIVGKPFVEGELMKVDIEFQAPGDIVHMPGTINDVHLHVTLRGLGWVVVQTHVRNVDVRARQRIYATPVGDDTIDIRGIVHVRKTGDKAFDENLAEIFFNAYVEDFAKDFPIWENKRYLTRPQLAKGDGPIGMFRRWCAQLYGPAAPRQSAAAPSQAPDVPAPAPGTGKTLLKVLQPLQERVASTAEWLLGAARRRAQSVTGAQATPEPGAPRAPLQGGSAVPVHEAPAAARSGEAPSSFPVTSADEYFETLEKRFVPAAAAGVDAVFQWELAGEGGSVFHAVVSGGRLDVRRGAHARPTVTLALPAADYVRVVNGDLDGVRAFTTGGGKVKGSVMAAMKMRSLFPAAGAR